MKEKFNEIEIELIRFDAVDVITTSNGGLDDNELPPDFFD